jgi:hypothetical protein
MKKAMTALSRLRNNCRVVAATLLAAGAIGGWAMSNILAAHASSVDGGYGFARKGDLRTYEDLKYSLVGSYAVTATDTEGRPHYGGPKVVAISLAPSGAVELDWGNGKQVGVGQLVGNSLAVASVTDGRTSILMMTINADGSLSGTWSRRTDRGYKGTESWKKI